MDVLSDDLVYAALLAAGVDHGEFGVVLDVVDGDVVVLQLQHKAYDDAT